MADKDDSDIGAFLTGFVIGGLVGAAVALILAPQSGTETREQIRQKGIELKEQGEEKLTDARTKAEAAATEARARAEKMAAEAKTRAEHLAAEAKSRAEELSKQGRVVLTEQRTKLQDAIQAGRKAAGGQAHDHPHEHEESEAAPSAPKA